ncbi:hypothetical protein X975_02300, partial [Stegodyphus mimosarum]
MSRIGFLNWGGEGFHSFRETMWSAFYLPLTDSTVQWTALLHLLSLEVMQGDFKQLFTNEISNSKTGTLLSS